MSATSSVPARTPARRRRWGLAAGIASAIAVAAVIGARVHRPAPAPATYVRDVPHLEGGAIVFSDAYRRRAGIETTPVRRAAIVPAIRVVGTISFDPGRTAAVGTRIRGFVRKVLKFEGDAVDAGAALAEIESPEVGQAEAELAMARAQAHAATANAQREGDLYERRLTTAREVEVANATRESVEASLTAAEHRVKALGGDTAGYGVHVVRAPIAGSVVERRIFAGQSVDPDQVAFRVADLSSLWIELAVFERNIDAVKVGDAVEVSPLSDPSHRFRGNVAHVGDVIDTSTRSADVRVRVDNAEKELRPGQSVVATIHASGRAVEGLVVPVGAVILVDGRPTVFLARGAGHVVPTEVTLGESDGAQQEVTSGVAERDLVVSAGAFALKSELFR